MDGRTKHPAAALPDRDGSPEGCWNTPPPARGQLLSMEMQTIINKRSSALTRAVRRIPKRRVHSTRTRNDSFNEPCVHVYIPYNTTRNENVRRSITLIIVGENMQAHMVILEISGLARCVPVSCSALTKPSMPRAVPAAARQRTSARAHAVHHRA